MAILTMMRRIYHSVGDRIEELIDVELDGAELSGIEFVDFFRYDPSTPRDVRTFLGQRDDFWQRPEDTGFGGSTFQSHH